MKHAFSGLINSLDTVEERISELAICQQKLPKVNNREKKDQGKNKNKRQKKLNRMFKNCEATTKGITNAKWKYQSEKKEKENRRNFQSNNE